MGIGEIFKMLENKTMEVGFRFHADSFQCTESAFGEVTFEWDGNTNYKITMLTELHIPQIKRPSSCSEYEWITGNKSGTLNYTETKRDDITGKEVSRSYKVKFMPVFEYQNDHNLHVVQFMRVPEKSETTKGWVFESYNEGIMHLTGEGFPKSIDKAIELFRNAANQGHAGAKKKLEELTKPTKGKQTFNNGDVYEGEIINEKANGKGKYTYASGGSYEGSFVDGKFNGKGKATFASGSIYVGDWADGKKHGKGKFVMANGTIYEGDYVQDIPNGKGKMTYPNGDFYEGDYANGKANGKGKHTEANGDIYEGDWVDNKSHGKGKKIYKNGKVENGNWKDGKFLG